MRKWSVMLVLVSVLMVATPRAEAGDYAKDAGIGTACVFINILYMPAKLVYATLGGLTGRMRRLGRRVVLALDNYEVFRLADTWIRQSFVPALPDNARLVATAIPRPTLPPASPNP